MSARCSAALAAEHKQRRSHQDFHIEPQRRISYVPDIECGLIIDRERPPAVDLCPSGQAGTNQQARLVTVGLVYGQQGPGANERHLTDQDIVQLRKFVEPRLPQEAAECRRALLIRYAAPLPVMRSRHSSELVK